MSSGDLNNNPGEGEGIMDQRLLPRPPTKKWVTFEDLIDDALESGKLSPRKAKTQEMAMLTTTTTTTAAPRRSSLCSSSTRSSVSSSTGHRILDFTQSLNSSNSCETLRGLFATGSETTLSSESETSCFSPPKNEEDKYTAAFGPLKAKSGAYKGWSGKVLYGGNNKFGWSEQILDSSDSGGEEETKTVPAETTTTPPNNLELEEEAPAWYAFTSAAGGRQLKHPSWDRSPSRTFVRNFP